MKEGSFELIALIEKLRRNEQIVSFKRAPSAREEILTCEQEVPMLEAELALFIREVYISKMRNIFKYLAKARLMIDRNIRT